MKKDLIRLLRAKAQARVKEAMKELNQRNGLKSLHHSTIADTLNDLIEILEEIKE